MTKKQAKQIKKLVRLSLMHPEKKIRKKNWKRLKSKKISTISEILLFIKYICNYSLKCKMKVLSETKHDCDCVDIKFDNSLLQPIDTFMEKIV